MSCGFCRKTTDGLKVIDHKVPVKRHEQSPYSGAAFETLKAGVERNLILKQCQMCEEYWICVHTLGAKAAGHNIDAVRVYI